MFKAGDVINITYFPNQETSSKGTQRPVLIVNVTSNGYDVMPLTSQLHQAASYKKTILIKKDDAIGKKIGLRCDSLVVVDRKRTISNKFPITPQLIGNAGIQFILDNNL
jgi:hypothetical protein